MAIPNTSHSRRPLDLNLGTMGKDMGLLISEVIFPKLLLCVQDNPTCLDEKLSFFKKNIHIYFHFNENMLGFILNTV